MRAILKARKIRDDLVARAVSGSTADGGALQLYNGLQTELKASVMRQTMI